MEAKSDIGAQHHHHHHDHGDGHVHVHPLQGDMAEGPRRPGDPAVLIASSAKISERLGWKPERDLRAMVRH